MLLYDRFDVWELDPTGVKPAVGRHRFARPQEHLVPPRRGAGGGRGGRGGGGAGGSRRRRRPRLIDPAEPLLLRAFNEETKASGFYRDQLGAQQAPEKIVMGDLAYGTPQKAKNADVYMVTKSTFVDFPNLWVGPSLTQLDEDLRREPAAEGLQLGHRGARDVDERRRRAAPGHPLQAGELRPDQEVSDDLVLLRGSVGRPAQLRRRPTGATSSTRRTTSRTAT